MKNKCASQRTLCMTILRHFCWCYCGVAACVSPCWSGSALRDTMALIAGKVMLDMAATAPAAHIILKRKINHQTLSHTHRLSIGFVHVVGFLPRSCLLVCLSSSQKTQIDNLMCAVTWKNKSYKAGHDILDEFHWFSSSISQNYVSEQQLAVKYLVKNPLNKAYETLQLVLISSKNPITICLS